MVYTKGYHEKDIIDEKYPYPVLDQARDPDPTGVDIELGPD